MISKNVVRILLGLIFAYLSNSHFCAQAAEPTLTIVFGAKSRVYTASQLLAQPYMRKISIPADVAYRRAMSYRAVPLLALLGPDINRNIDTLEARANDGFVSQIPVRIIQKARTNGSIAWVAIEPLMKPWPALPNKARSAGPFYIVWEKPGLTGIGQEQWPYGLVQLSGAETPERRWPQIDVASTLPANAPERRGMRAFIRNCFSCHRIRGGGAATLGPDLADPMSPLKYMTPKGLRLLIRNPSAVRTWPDQKMTGFSKSVLSDPELEDLISYLAHIAERRLNKQEYR
jgi:mono/diheme cytochrome c family protein